MSSSTVSQAINESSLCLIALEDDGIVGHISDFIHMDWRCKKSVGIAMATLGAGRRFRPRYCFGSVILPGFSTDYNLGCLVALTTDVDSGRELICAHADAADIIIFSCGVFRLFDYGNRRFHTVGSEGDIDRNH